MLATLDEHPFTREGWLFERKLDGERCIAYRCGDSVRLRSRNDAALDDTYPELVDALRAQAVDDFVVDGEVVAFAGRSTSFAKLQRRMHVHDARMARRSPVKVFFYLFDVVYLAGHDITGLPLYQRKALLRRAMTFADPVRYTPHRVTAGEQAFAQACARGWEGIIAKRAASTYAEARSREWLKWKCLQVGEFVVGGYTAPAGGRTGFGALLVGTPDSGEGLSDDATLVFAGRVGTGFDEATLARLHGLLTSLEVDRSPFIEGAAPAVGGAHLGAPDGRGHVRPGRRAGGEVRWVRPVVVIRVGFVERTPDRRLRHPRFLGIVTEGS